MYHYELLGDERFQSLCQDLVLTVFPRAQCLPVGQPDGGRDAFSVSARRNSDASEIGLSEMTVFQVKFSRFPKGERSARDEIEEIIKSEKPKIDKLKKRGLKKYVLITNIQGTANIDVGSIDKVNSLLSREFEIDSECWWRDDLDRRIDVNSKIKWSFPEILRATDLLEKLVENKLGEDQIRRQSAIRAFIASQFEADKELKFKQTDLRSEVKDLFVDLPMMLPESSSNRHIYLVGEEELIIDHRNFRVIEPDSLNVCEQFLKRSVLEHPKIVLEGAPGQGKSTVTQYLCQVLRAQLLNFDLTSFQYFDKSSLVARIPFRVDLRDVAKWFQGIDPFTPKPSQLDPNEPRSLEGFLAAQVRAASGGHDFSVSDLAAIASECNLFLALDGFDEVAERSDRQNLVDEISKSVARLKAAGNFILQVLVTSRPAAFSKSVRFSEESWAYGYLLPLEKSHIDEYTSKWIKAKGLKDDEKLRVTSILDDKIEDGHIRYLSKNPMQLSILLHLIYVRNFLPEKRTEMYDSYMQIFFDRESEKNEMIRHNRDLVIDIHRYLAWELQAKAEDGGNGRIEQSGLKKLLFSYLSEQQEDTSIVERLFDGIVERVGVLVSRVQESYEFEVQPLREYFAAKHLYETAPYSNEESAYKGDKLHRFRALMGNPYWRNVLRFYAGCFNKGEVYTLVAEIIELGDTERYQNNSEIRETAAILLSDWVFSQYQPAVKQIVGYIAQPPGFRLLLKYPFHPRSEALPSLHDKCGRKELLQHCWSYLGQNIQYDVRVALAQIIRSSATPQQILDSWFDIKTKMTDATWARLGQVLGVFRNIDQDTSGRVSELRSPYTVRALLSAERYDLIEEAGLTEAAIDILKKARLVFGHRVNNGNMISQIAIACSPQSYSLALGTFENASLAQIHSERLPGSTPGDTLKQQRLELSPLSESYSKLIEEFHQFSTVNIAELSQDIRPWAAVINAAQNALGKSTAVERIALIASGVKDRTLSASTGVNTGSLLLDTCKIARMKSGAPNWWAAQLLKSGCDNKRLMLLLLLLWATPKTLMKLATTLDDVLASLSIKEWTDLIGEFDFIDGFVRTRASKIQNDHLPEILSLNLRSQIFIGKRLSASSRFEIVKCFPSDDTALTNAEIDFAMETTFDEAMESGDWQQLLPLIKRFYALAHERVPFVYARKGKMPIAIAREILQDPETYPCAIVSIADDTATRRNRSRAIKLIKIAEDDGWFKRIQ